MNLTHVVASKIRMSALNWPRIILCGLITGVVFTLLTMILIGTLGSEFLAAAGAHGAAGDGKTKTGLALYLATIFPGLWAMWLYAVIRHRFASRIGAVVTVSLAWWIIASVQSLKWILLLGLPLSVCLPLTLNLAPAVIAVLVGSTLFGDVQPNPVQPTPDGVPEPAR